MIIKTKRTVLRLSVCAFVGEALEKQKCRKSEQLAADETHAAELASTRRCPAAGMDHIRDVLSDTDTWISNCLMNRPYMDTVIKTKVYSRHVRVSIDFIISLSIYRSVGRSVSVNH